MAAGKSQEEQAKTVVDSDTETSASKSSRREEEDVSSGQYLYPSTHSVFSNVSLLRICFFWLWMVSSVSTAKDPTEEPMDTLESVDHLTGNSVFEKFELDCLLSLTFSWFVSSELESVERSKFFGRQRVSGESAEEDQQRERGQD